MNQFLYEGEIVNRTVGYYRFPPVDPITGDVSAEDDSISMGQMKHCDLPGRHRRADCTDIMHDHFYIDVGTRAGVVLCPKGMFIPNGE